MARLGLKARLIGTIALVMVAVVALLTLLAIRRLGDSLEGEFISKGEAVALALAKGMEQSQVTGISAIQDSVASDDRLPGVCYIYVVDETGFVTAHAFAPTFPQGFEKVTAVRAEEITPPAQVKVSPRIDYPAALCAQARKGERGLEAIDIAAPVLGGASGFVHVGMDRRIISRQVAALRNAMLGSGLLVVALALALSAAALVAFVSRPIGELTRVTGEIVRKGDLSQKIEVASEDEIGVLADSFRQMVGRLRTVPVTLKAQVTSLGEAVNGLSAVTRQQNTTLQRQATGLSEASSTALEIKQTSAMAAGKAKAVAQVTGKAEEIALTGQRSLEASVLGLEEIRRQTEAIVGTIVDLAQRTLQVGEIIESVKDLADQSNVLALNAAIEAAKAGEFGKGFGVVAREIRSLADQSLKATGRIREILLQIQSAIRSAVSITEEGKRRMEESLTQIGSSGDTLKEMTAIVEESSQAARHIAVIVGQQDQGITQISQAMATLSTGMEETTGGIQVVEASVQNLTAIADRIKGLVESFKV